MKEQARMPTSKQINEAIETLRSAKVEQSTIAALDRWNAARIMASAKHASSREDVAALLDGINPEVLAEAGIV